MRFLIFKMCISACALIGISGCASSLVYSPSLNLPTAPLKKETGQLIAGGILLPETRPRAVSQTAEFGADATLRYGFSDNFSLGVKTWSDIDKLDDYWRGGISIHSIIALKTGENESGFNFGIIPTIAFLNSGNTYEGGGGSVAFATWFPKIGVVAPYASFGPALGFRDTDQWGYGAIGNVGVAMDIFKNFTLNAEVAGIIQVNEYDNITHGIVAPSIAIGWNF